MSPLFVPGPVDVAEEVLQAQTRAMLPHRSGEYEEIFHRAEKKSRALFGTVDNRVFLSASSGTGFHEAAVRNLVSGKMLSCTNGAFGNRWFDVGKTNGKDVDKLENDWQQPIMAEKVAEAVKGQNYDIVTIVHNETSTGLMNPVGEIAAAVREASPDTLICVDAVSSLSGTYVEMDKWGVDLILTSSQKALAIPPGLSLAAISDRALERAKTVENRGWYFDFLRMEKHRISNSTAATSAVGLIYALDVQMDRILAEGIENRYARHAGMAAHTHKWALDNGFALCAPEGYRSHTVSTVMNTKELDFAALSAFLLERDMRMANGYGPNKNITFRIAHMGELTNADLDVLFAAIGEFMG